ncbi:MAG: TRIC cation channel family protein [Ferruginibacter sp.]
MFLFDAMGLGLFTIIGIEKAIELNFSVGVCIALGTITASFGGVIRDVLLNNVPLVFRKEIYALASIIGGLCYFVLRSSSLDNDVAKIICILLILLIRLLAVKYKLGLPAFYAKNNKGES